MQFKGILSFTRNENVLYQFPDNKFIVISDSADNYVNKYPNNAIIGSVLLPPYESMVYYADNNENSFIQSYQAYLASGAALSFLNVIVRAVLSGTNIILFIPNGESDMGFEQILLSHIQMIYGITVATEGNNMMYDPIFDAQVDSLLYQSNLFTTEEFLMEYPEGVPLFQDVIPMLEMEIRAPIISSNPADYLNWFNSYKDRVKHVGHVLEVPITKGQ